MTIKKAGITFFLCLIPLGASALTITPDSVTANEFLLSFLRTPLGTVGIKNSGNTEVLVDSVHIRFLNGEQFEFQRCSDCDTADFGDYNYDGWIYGVDNPLRYLSDSLFLLQDSAGNRISFPVPAHDSVEFVLNVVVNCPVCARIPTFPSTTDYQFLFFHSSGDCDTLILTMENSALVREPRPVHRANHSGGKEGGRFNCIGQRLQEYHGEYNGLLLKPQSAIMHIGGTGRRGDEGIE